MSTDQASREATRVDVRNIGGIDEATVTLPPGVSVLSGRNATNRTSFLQALMAGLGSRRSSLKGDADEGSVTLSIGEQTYSRTLTRRGDTVVFDGDPYLDDPELADLFAFLLENNEARQAVARGDDLREIIMRPIDTDQIEAEIESSKRERDELQEEIERLDEIERELPGLEADRRKNAEELADAQEELADAKARLDELDTGIKESRSRKQELEDAFQRVRDARSTLEDLEFDLETERSTLAEYETEREKLRETLADTEAVEENSDRLAGQIDELRRRKRSLDDTVNELSSVISFNKELLEEDGLDEVDTGDTTDALVAGGETVCWTCGSAVKTDQIAETIDRLQSLRSERLDERNEVRAEIDELTDTQSSIRSRKRERERTETGFRRSSRRSRPQEGG